MPRKKRLDICTKCEKSVHPAITAVKAGHINCLSTVYKDLGVVNERDDYGATPIHYAARYGKLKCLEWLVNRSGVSPNAASSSGSTAAHDAASKGHLDCLRYLILNTNCVANDRTYEGATVFHIACRFGRTSCVKFLLEEAECTPSDKGTSNVTPVHICAAHNHLSCLKLLTPRHDYKPNEITVHGATPTYFAAQEGSLDCLVWLVRHGNGDLYMEATDGMGPLHAASQGGQLDCVKWMIQDANLIANLKAADGATPAHFSAASGQVECLEWLLDNGGSVIDRDDLGGTPAHDAAEQGQIVTLELLMSKGADVSIIDNEGLTPLDLAQENQQEDCVKMLFKATQTSPGLYDQGYSGDNELSPEEIEKQRQFEASLTGAEEAKRDEIWNKAQAQEGTKVLPGLGPLLAGEEDGENISMGVDFPTGSLRHSRHSSIRSRVSNKKESTRSPLTENVFKEPTEDEITFSTFRIGSKKDKTQESAEAIITDAPLGDGNFERKSSKRESFLKRLFSRKRSSSSEPQSPPPPQKKQYNKENGDPQPQKKMSLEEKIEFHKTVITVEVFDDTQLPPLSEEVPQRDLDATTASVEEIAQSVTENVVTQALLVVENDDSKQDSSNQPVLDKISAKGKKKRRQEDGPPSVEKAVVSRDRASTAYSAPFVETVKVEFKKDKKGKRAFVKSFSSSDLDYDSSPESTDSEPEGDQFGIKPMEVDEFQQFGEDVEKFQALQEQREAEFNRLYPEEKKTEDESLTDANLTSFVDDPKQPSEKQPTDDAGIPPTVVNSIHRDLQLLSDSIDKDLDKLLNEGNENDGDELNIEDMISSSESNIALEKLEEAQIIPQSKSTPKVAPKVKREQKESTLVSNKFSADPVQSMVRRLSGQFEATGATSSQTGARSIKKSNSIQEKLKMFGENIDETKATPPPKMEKPKPSLKPKPVEKTTTQEVVKVEEEKDDEVKPLKLITPTSLRRSSLNNVDKLKLDGLKGEEQVPVSPLSPDAMKKQWRMSPLEMVTKPGSPVSARRTIDLGSPLSPSRSSFKKHDPEALNLFMNSANVEYLTKLHEQKLDEHKLLAIKRANALLEEPILSDYRVPEAFREILSLEKTRFIWCIKDTWYSWLEPAEELPLEMSSEECYILLHIQDTGPLKYHIFIWMGNKAKDSDMKSAYSWCNKLVQSLPGRPVVYRETEGHESTTFLSLFNRDIELDSPSVPYFNDKLEKPQLYRYKDAVLTEIKSCVLHLEEEGTDVTLLATSTKLFIWLMPQIWNSEPSAIWEAANVYLTKNGQPLWAPVVMLTQYGETKEFFAHLCCWQHADMKLSSQVEQLSLPNKKRHTVRYPAIGKIKIWLLQGSTQSLLPLDKLGQFKSSNAYLVEFKYQRWQTVFLWVGSHISFELHDNSVLVTAVNWCKKKMTKPELIVIPQGLETKEFLNLFKGKCLIRDPKPGSDVHLYKVIGNDVLRTKTIEVAPSATSLNSTHAFIVCKEDSHFAWSGQFSSQAERRGALIINNQVGPPDSLPVLLAEGLETPEFWSLLGGKNDYPHHSSSNQIPDYYSNSIYLCKGTHFMDMYHFSKDDVNSTDVILIWTSNEIYLWTGSKADVEGSVHTVKEYIKQYHTKTLNEFVIHLVHEGAEPQHFWDLFSPPKSASSTNLVNTKRDEPEDEELMTLLSDINSMVINLSTSSVPNINELGISKPVSPLQERFKSIKDSPLSQSCQADLQFVGLSEAKSTDKEQKPIEPVDQVAAAQPTEAIKKKTWSLKVDPTTYQWLTVPAVLHNDMAKKDGKLKKKAKGYLTSVTVEDWKGTCANLIVDSSISTLALIFLAAPNLKIDVKKDLTLFEANDDIGIERIIEDHELVKDVMSFWPKKANSRLVLKEMKDKHQLWTGTMMEGEVRGFTENDVVTKETFTMSIMKNSKGKWSEEDYTYMHDGIYSTSTGQHNQKKKLVAKFSTHNIYVASKKSKKRPLSGPTSFGLVIKPIDSFKDKDCIIACAKDPVSWMKFILLFRLLKHGTQLKGNYLAVLERLKA